MPPIEVHTHFIDKIAFVNGLIGGVALYPQIFNIVYNGADNSFSGVSLIIISLNGCVWMCYAIHRRLVSIFVASLLNTVAALLLLTL